MISSIPITVFQYIAVFPKDTRVMLKKFRAAIKQAAPDAAESVFIGIPAYKTFGRHLVYFAGYKTHIGFDATPNAHRQGKGFVQFHLNKPRVPYDLIKCNNLFMAAENKSKVKK